jgi:hypothetical protein
MHRTLALIATLLLANTCWAATAPVSFTRPTGGTYYAYPTNHVVTDWTTYRVAFSDSGHLGLYTATLDTVVSTDWVIFEGATQPASFADALAPVSVLEVNIDENLGEVLEDTSITLDDLVDDLETRLTALRAGYFDNIPTILTDTNELQTDWVNGGRLDLLIDSAVAQATAAASSAATAVTDIGNVPTNAELATAIDPLPTAVENATELLNTVTSDTGVGEVGRALHYLRTAWASAGVYSEAALAEAPTGGAGTLTDVDQEPVPSSRTYTLVATENDGLAAEKPKSMADSDEPTTFAVDFRSDMAVNDRITVVGTPTLVGSPSSGITFDDLGRDKSLAKFRVTPADAGTYTIRVPIEYHSGNTATGTIVLVVAE